MYRQFVLSAAVLAILVLGASAASAEATASDAASPMFSGHRLAAAAHISLADARDIALKARPGVITDQELEREGGGSGLRYSFDIRSAGATYEVGVDAKTGKLLENGREGARPD
jgi:uncharacterized membrane protein YkoI